MESDFDRSDSDELDANPGDHRLTFDSTTSLLPSSFYKSNDLLTRDGIHQSLPRHKAHYIPAEIFSEIFLYTVQADPNSRRELMLVCRHWHEIMLSTPGIHSQLRIHRETKKKYVERFGKRWLLDVTVDPNLVTSDPEFWSDPETDPETDLVEFHACFMAAAEAASRWRSLAILSLPPPGVYKDLRIIHPLQHLESFELASSCDLGNFLEPLLNAITTTVTPRFTVMEVFHPDAALYLLQPPHFQIFSSLTTLRLTCRRMQNHVDILTPLHKLEIFEAHYLFLPIYRPRINLPLTQTLRVLHLKSVSVQWMTGQTFPVLMECSIIFPHHADAIQSVNMHSCLILKYHSNNLGALENFHISSLENLEISCGQWRTWGGNLQLIHLNPIFAAQSLTRLHLEIKCSEWLLIYILRLAPALEELWMGLSNPHALSSGFFLALAAGGHKTNAGSSSQTIIPLCRKLKMLHLHYKRWSRGPERNALIPAFGAVVASHPPEDRFRFHLSLLEGSKLQEWYIRKLAESFDISKRPYEITIGVPSPDGIVHLSKEDYSDADESLVESECIQLPRETEYIIATGVLTVSDDFLFSFHSLKEVRTPHSDLGMKRDPQFPLDAPLFHTLKVLHVGSISSSFFAGQTFHKLERYREDRLDDWDILGKGPLTEMPVCTRLVVSLLRLATLKLPQIRVLGLLIDTEPDRIWEKHIAVNANLSGLKFLHLRYNHTIHPTVTVIKILESLPALEALITDVDYLGGPPAHFFEAFVPMNVPGPSGLGQSGCKGQISGVLCPRLEILRVEGVPPTRRGKPMPVLKDIVTLRAIIGSPLKSFIIYFDGDSVVPRMWQLIGRDKSFMMEQVFGAEKFRLYI